jgi:magnesium transporter
MTEQIQAELPAEAMRDDDDQFRPEFLVRVVEAIEAADADFIRELITDLHEADIGDLIEALEADLRPRLVELAGDTFHFSALNEVDDSVRDELLEDLPPATVAEGISELESDDAVALLEDLPEENQEQILEQLPQEERDVIERGLEYPENSAGRRMQTDFIAVPPDWTVGRTIDYLRESTDLPDRFFEIYAIEPDNKLRGSVSLDRMMRSQRPVEIMTLVEEDRRRVLATDDQEEVARLFEKYNLVAAPVVDVEDRLVGVVTVDDVVDVIEEEAEEDLRQLGGVTSDEELSDTVWTVARGRFSWLLVNLATAFIAAFVLSQFEVQLEQMVVLAVLAPVVASQGGNAATQAMTVAVRALATRELSSSNARRVVLRELMVGFVNGFGFAIITGTAAALWFGIPHLGLVFGLAIVCNLTVAGLGGVTVPLIMDKLKLDPALASGVFVTTITDVVGYSCFLGIATLWFGLK